MVLGLLLGAQLLQYCLAAYVAHVYWPRSIIGYYHIPVMQKMRYVLPAPEEIGHHLPTALAVQPPAQHVMTAPEIMDVAPTAVESVGTIVAHQPYSAIQTVNYHGGAPAPVLIAEPAGSTLTGYQGTPMAGSGYGHAGAIQTAAIRGDKQFSTDDTKSRVPKMAITPNNAPQVDAAANSYAGDGTSETSYASSQNAPEESSYQEKPDTAVGYQPEKEKEVAASPVASEQPAQYTAEDQTSRTGYKLRRIVLQ